MAKMVNEWLKEQESELIKLWQEGNSAAQTARKMEEMFGIKFTKNMIIGKIHRLIDAKKMTPREDYKPVTVKPKQAKAERKAEKVVSQSYEAAATVPPVSLGDNVIMFVPLRKPPAGRGVTLESVSGCLYATGMDAYGRHLFCNDQKKEGSAYCAEHHAKCHVAIKPVADKRDKKWRPF